MMRTKYNLSVTLTPLEHYFFGGENLNTDGTDKYLQHSIPLPQQTTILGTMRFLLLQLADKTVFDGNKIIDKAIAKELIGSNSFDMATTQYGKIEALSEVLLWHKEKGFYTPLLAWEDKKENVTLKAEIGAGECFFGKDCHKPNLLLHQYEAKKGVKQYWIGQDGKPFNEEEEKEIFSEYNHAGNFKNKQNKTEDDEDAYFKMRYYRLHTDFSFVLNMRISDDDIIAKLIKENRMLNLGGERSKFICEIKKIDDTNPKSITDEAYKKVYSSLEDTQFTKVILTSDAYADNDLYKDSLLAITQIKKMRFLQSCVDKTNAYNNRRKAEYKQDDKKQADDERLGLKQSKLFNLLQRGSVFYFEKGYDVDKFLKHAAFETIGYNTYYKL